VTQLRSGSTQPGHDRTGGALEHRCDLLVAEAFEVSQNNYFPVKFRQAGDRRPNLLPLQLS
jgi:hypothetical protein